MSELYGYKYSFDSMVSEPEQISVRNRVDSINSEISEKTLNDILFTDYDDKNMSVGDYITDPCLHVINHPEFKDTCGVSKILTSPTGGGKTYLTITKIVPQMFLNGVGIVVYVVPEISLFDRALFENIKKSPVLKEDDIQPAVLVHDEVKHLEASVESNSHIFIAITRQFLVQSAVNGKNLLNLMINLKDRFDIDSALISDEAHIASTSGFPNYRKNTGSSNPRYEAKYYKKLRDLSYFTPYIIGLTATESFEQIGKLEVVDKMKYSVINKKPNRYKMSTQSAWLKQRFTYSYTKGKKYNSQNILNMQNSTSITLKMYLKIMRKYPRYKQSMLIKTGRSNCIMSLHETLKFFKEEIERLAPELINTYCFAELTEKGARLIKINEDGSFKIKKEDTYTVLKKANSLTDDLRFLFVVEKGGVGLNVNTLKWLISYRITEPKGVERNFVMNNPKQLVGRLVRPYFLMGSKKFKEMYSNNYNTTDYINDMTDEEFEAYCEMNSIRMLTCDNSYWSNVVRELTEETLIRTEEAKNYHFFRRQMGIN